MSAAVIIAIFGMNHKQTNNKLVKIKHKHSESLSLNTW